MDCKFVVGQKVVCIKEGEWSGEKQPGFNLLVPYIPRKGDVLTIRTMVLDEECNRIGLTFVEMKNPKFKHSTLGMVEMTFDATRFRPLDERKTESGMTILRGILDDVNAGREVKIKEDA